MIKTLLIEHAFGQRKNSIKDTPAQLLQFIRNGELLKSKNGLIPNLINIYDNIKDQNLFIGGDHSISIATISKIYKPGMKIIWVDAHADINTYEESISKNYHGMPLAILTGLDILTDYPQFNLQIPFEDILYIGLRSIDPFEEKIIKEKNIKYFKSDLDNYQTIIKEFIGDSLVHISFDVDSLDPICMPCTGTREEDGISKEDGKKLFDYLLNFNVCSMDIVELNLGLGSSKDYQTSLETLFYVLQNYDLFINQSTLFLIPSSIDINL